MTFYILANQITTLFISLNLLTTLSFDSEIISYMYGGSKEEIFFKVTNNNRTLALKPTMDSDYSNLLVITKERRYYFDIKKNKDKPHQFIEVKDGIRSHALKSKVNNSSYQILEGQKSILFINKKSNPVIVNNIEVKSKEYFSKGVPIILDGKRILN
ncbi:MAG: TrbG/VirB9 family P-type conjugative transfer protein [Bacteriovoracaceae bacterium]|jgi:type IV secretory pathway VirB9-like protein|nr:TrbG/VirB9 family P-type conjugative transfer protein [Bacteriovoracaceae bacterium]